MDRVTQVFTYARPVVNAMVSALKTVPGGALLTTPKVRLYASGGPVTPDAALADFTATAASGIADLALTLTGAVNEANNTQAMVGTCTFLSTTTGTYVSGTAEGYVITDGTSAYYGGEQFSAPVNFGTNGDYLTLDVVLPVNCSEAANVT
jgi:hypothetical protein